MNKSYNKILHMLDKNIKANQKSLDKLQKLNFILSKLSRD